MTLPRKRAEHPPGVACRRAQPTRSLRSMGTAVGDDTEAGGLTHSLTPESGRLDPVPVRIGTVGDVARADAHHLGAAIDRIRYCAQHDARREQHCVHLRPRPVRPGPPEAVCFTVIRARGMPAWPDELRPGASANFECVDTDAVPWRPQPNDERWIAPLPRDDTRMLTVAERWRDHLRRALTWKAHATPDTFRPTSDWTRFKARLRRCWWRFLCRIAPVLRWAARRWWHPPISDDDRRHETEVRAVIDRADVVIAAYDREPDRRRSSVHQAVRYARRRGVPTIVLDTTRRRVPIAPFFALGQQEFDAHPLDTNEATRVLQDVRGPGPTIPPLADAAAEHFLHPFVRADQMALQWQTRFTRRVSFAIVVAGIGTLSSAFGATAQRDWRWLSWLDSACVTTVLVILLQIRRGKMNRRWIGYRVLAERLRCAYFLAAAGTHHRPRTAVFADREDQWIAPAFDAIWRDWRVTHPAQAAIPEHAQQYLRATWLDGQYGYHVKTMRKAAKYLRAARLFAPALAVVVIMSFVNALVIFEPESIEARLSSFSTFALPAVAAATYALIAQRELGRTEHRSRAIRSALHTTTRRLIDPDMNESDYQATLDRIDSIMADELREWFGVMATNDPDIV